MREAIVTATLAMLIVVTGLLAWQNAGLKEELTLAGGGEGRPGIGDGDRLGRLEVLTSSGERRTLFSGRGPAPILLLIFNTSCPHCENSLPDWNRLAGLFAGRGIEVLGVSLDDTGSTSAYAVRHGLPFPVASILDVGYLPVHGIDGVPTTVLADDNGNVLGAWQGELTPGMFSEITRRISGGDSVHIR